MPNVREWTKIAADVLVGRKITKVEYVDWGEGQLGVGFVLDDGTTVQASRDDEGNGPGALFTNREGAAAILPVISKRWA